MLLRCSYLLFTSITIIMLLLEYYCTRTLHTGLSRYYFLTVQSCFTIYVEEYCRSEWGVSVPLYLKRQ